MKSIRKVAFCPHCGNRAPQCLLLTQQFLERGFHMDGTLDEHEFISAYYVAKCETCSEILLYYALDEFPEKNRFTDASLMYPIQGILDQNVPERVRLCYEEAMRIKNTAPNAYAVQIRRALEALCDDRAAKKGTLQKRLQELSSRGEIPPLLAEMTGVLRLLGNIGAHAGEQSVKPGFVRAIDEFFRALIEYVYVAPSKLKAFRDKLEKLK
jgi:hypothetical protein